MIIKLDPGVFQIDRLFQQVLSLMKQENSREEEPQLFQPSLTLSVLEQSLIALRMAT
jgi:hypothetical protein